MSNEKLLEATDLDVLDSFFNKITADDIYLNKMTTDDMIQAAWIMDVMATMVDLEDRRPMLRIVEQKERRSLGF